MSRRAGMAPGSVQGRGNRPGRKLVGSGGVKNEVVSFARRRPSDVGPLSIQCPECKVPVGERCVKPDGSPYASNNTHVSRRRMAIRRDNETRTDAPDVVPVRLGPLVDPDGRECPSCELMIKVRANGMLRSHTNVGRVPSTINPACPGEDEGRE